MLLDRDAIARVVELLRTDDFYWDAHRRIFAMITDLFERGEPVDLITVTDRLRDRGQLDEAGGAAYITALLNSVPTAANVGYYARIVRRDGMKRALAESFGELQRAALNAHDPDELLTVAHRVLGEFDSTTYREMSYPNRILTAADLLTATDQEQDWWPLWDQPGFIGPGIATLISGHSKSAGKTTSVSIGLRDLSRSKPDLRVLWLSEEPRSIWRGRFTAWGALPGWRLRFADGTPWPTMLHEVERAEAGIIVIDTLRSFGEVTDENDAARVVAAVQPLVLVSRRKHIGIIALHHLRKSEGEEGLAHAGSTALVALMDVALELRRDQHSAVRRVVRAVSRFDETPRALTLELRDRNIIALGPPDAVSLDAVAERILAVLPDAPEEGVTRAELLLRLDEPRPSREQVGRALQALRTRSRADASGRGVKGNPERWFRS